MMYCLFFFSLYLRVKLIMIQPEQNLGITVSEHVFSDFFRNIISVYILALHEFKHKWLNEKPIAFHYFVRMCTAPLKTYKCKRGKLKMDPNCHETMGQIISISGRMFTKILHCQPQYLYARSSF